MTGKTFSLLGDNQSQKINFEEQIKNTSNTESIKLAPNSFGKRFYVSNHSTEIFVNGGTLASYIHNQKFHLDFFAKGSGNKYRLEIIENYINDGLELVQKFEGLLQKIIQLKDNLTIITDNKGFIKEVENRQELKERWDLLKKAFETDESLKEIPKDSLKELFKKGDEEFSYGYPLEKDLENSVFHRFLFFHIYEKKLFFDKVNTLSDYTIKSVLFTDISIPLKTTLEIFYNEENNEYILQIESIIDKNIVSRSAVERLYKRTFPFIKERFSKYDVSVNMVYSIDAESHLLNYADIEIEEFVNNSLGAYQKLEIDYQENIS